ncbi:MAG: FAD:protein FMN transferase, partial [Anaerolineae bacterium]
TGSAMDRLLLTMGAGAGEVPGVPVLQMLKPAAALLPPEDGDPALGVEIDLGGIGKGFALDRVVEILADWDVTSALLNAGASTVLALDAPAGENGWRVGVGGPWGAAAGFDTVELHRMSLSGSGIEIKGEHVVDPRTGNPPQWHQAAWALCRLTEPSDMPATCLLTARSDALATAFLVMSTAEVESYCAEHTEVAALVVPRQEGAGGAHVFGCWPGVT